MSQTYYTNLTFLWYISPIASNILLHSLMLAALYTKKIAHFFPLYSPNRIILCTRSPTHTPKKAAQPEGKNPSKSSICHKYTWYTKLLPSTEEKWKFSSQTLFYKATEGLIKPTDMT